jgi:hypothetical protein
MTLRKGEITRARLRRQWSHHVALPAERMRGAEGYDIFHDFADARSAPRRTFFMRRDDIDLVVFCFAKAEDAAAFCDRFGGERLPETRR